MAKLKIFNGNLSFTSTPIVFQNFIKIFQVEPVVRMKGKLYGNIVKIIRKYCKNIRKFVKLQFMIESILKIELDLKHAIEIGGGNFISENFSLQRRNLSKE